MAEGVCRRGRRTQVHTYLCKTITRHTSNITMNVTDINNNDMIRIQITATNVTVMDAIMSTDISSVFHRVCECVRLNAKNEILIILIIIITIINAIIRLMIIIII